MASRSATARSGDSAIARSRASKKSLRAAQQDRPDVAEARAEWHLRQRKLDPSRLVFIDETWAKDNMTRLRGRCRRGHRLIGKIPLARWQTTTFLAALRLHGMTAPMVLDGPIDGTWFLAYVEQLLCPTLEPGDVILDNLGSHRSDKVRLAIEARGASLLYLPKYSPDLNPIENASSSRQPSGALPSVRPTPFGTASEPSSTPTLLQSAQTTSGLPAMTQLERTPL